MDMQEPGQQSQTPQLGRRRHIIKSLKAQADARRSPAERFADWLTDYFGTLAFLFVNGIWFFVWIVVNIGWVPGIQPFDPFPFGLLTMIVSLEAIMLAIIVLISQNRAAKVAELREEISLQINTITEEEVTKIMNMLSTLLEKHGVSVLDDPDLQRMLKPTDNAYLERRLQSQLEHNNKFKRALNKDR